MAAYHDSHEEGLSEMGNVKRTKLKREDATIPVQMELFNKN